MAILQHLLRSQSKVRLVLLEKIGAWEKAIHVIKDSKGLHRDRAIDQSQLMATDNTMVYLRLFITSSGNMIGVPYGNCIRARFLSLAQSKLRLCSANHRPCYWSNLPCDWPSTAWAYSEQEKENGLRYTVHMVRLRVSSDYAQPITDQVTEVTCPVIGRSQPELTPSKREKMDPGFSDN